MKRFLLTAAFATLTAVGAVGLYAVESLFRLGEAEERAQQAMEAAGYDEHGLRLVRDAD